MFDLQTTKNPSVLVVHFTHFDTVYEESICPFFDVLFTYYDMSGIEFKGVDFIYNYKFTEDGYKIQFYWDQYTKIFVFDIAKSQYRMIHDRLYEICVFLNRELANKEYFKKYGELPNHGQGFK